MPLHYLIDSVADVVMVIVVVMDIARGFSSSHSEGRPLPSLRLMISDSRASEQYISD
jgi:hypothetical protein